MASIKVSPWLLFSLRGMLTVLLNFRFFGRIIISHSVPRIISGNVSFCVPP